MEKPECFVQCEECWHRNTHCVADEKYAEEHAECRSCSFLYYNAGYVSGEDE